MLTYLGHNKFVGRMLGIQCEPERPQPKSGHRTILAKTVLLMVRYHLLSLTGYRTQKIPAKIQLLPLQVPHYLAFLLRIHSILQVGPMAK